MRSRAFQPSWAAVYVAGSGGEVSGILAEDGEAILAEDGQDLLEE